MVNFDEYQAGSIVCRKKGYCQGSWLGLDDARLVISEKAANGLLVVFCDPAGINTDLVRKIESQRWSPNRFDILSTSGKPNIDNAIIDLKLLSHTGLMELEDRIADEWERRSNASK